MTITYAVPFKIGGEEFLADAFLTGQPLKVLITKAN